MPGCCGGNGDALLQAKALIESLHMGGGPGGLDGQTDMEAPTQVLPTVVRMEFVGPQVGAVTFFGQRQQYQGGRDPLHRYSDVQPEDVARLESTGSWRVVTRASDPSPAPANPLLFHDREPEALVAVEEQGAGSFWMRKEGSRR